MKLSATYQPCKEYLLVNIAGDYDFLSSIILFHKILNESWKQRSASILCDIRKVKGFDYKPKEAVQRYTLTKYVGTTLPKNIRLAVIVTPRQLDIFGETIITKLGAHVKITTNMVVALHWLSAGVKKPVYF